jgi:hypothetical protein
VKDGPTALYRYFDDKDRLLYVGITDSLSSREHGHIRSSLWMQLVASSTVERHAVREDALVAERTAIKTERPLFNRQYNDTPDARRRLRAYLEEVGRMDLHVLRKPGGMPPGELEMMRARKRKPRPAAKPTNRSAGDSQTRIIPAARFQVVQIAIPALQDDCLSLAACGLLALSMSFPAGARFTTEQLAGQRPDSHEDILAALAELDAHGYFRDGIIHDSKIRQVPGAEQLDEPLASSA